MKYIIQTFLLLTITSQFVFAQEILPILKTNQTTVSIKEGNFDYKDSWTIAPEVKPDVFVTQKFTGTQIITFYSDIDAISFTVKPNKKYDFIILLNGKDKAYTQISTDSKQNPSLEPKLFYTRLKKHKPSNRHYSFHTWKRQSYPYKRKNKQFRHIRFFI